MSQHHSDPVEASVESHPVKLVIGVTIGAVGLVVGIIMLAYFAVGSHRIGETDSNANKPDVIAQRIAPVTILVVEPPKVSVPATTPAVAPKSANAPVIATVIPPLLPPAIATGAPSAGEGVYKASCFACHATGVAGAPKIGDKGDWSARVAKGKALLYDHALKGFNNVMPAKGGNPALSDADVRAAVDYLVAQVR
jgi:cytochrome c5